MGKHQKTRHIVTEAYNVLRLHHPMTVRQMYYQLVSKQIIKNNRSQYQAVSKVLVEARKDGTIPWQWIEDRLRRPRAVSMWEGIGDFAETAVNAYRRDIWQAQNCLVEVWLEKDALSGIFEDILSRYGVTLNVGRGYDGWDSIHNASERYKPWHTNVVVLYFGDFDPSGEDMVRSLRERLAFFDTCPEIIKCALTRNDIERYNLPSDFTKPTDTRSAGFVAKWGNLSVELDALPIDVLQERLRNEVEQHMELDALRNILAIEHEDRQQIGIALTMICPENRQ